MSEKTVTPIHPACSAYSADDRGNVVDCYGQQIDGTWERVGILDREAGPSPCISLAWDNWFSDPGLESFMRKEGYGDELNEAAQNKQKGLTTGAGT